MARRSTGWLLGRMPVTTMWSPLTPADALLRVQRIGRQASVWHEPLTQWAIDPYLVVEPRRSSVWVQIRRRHSDAAWQAETIVTAEPDPRGGTVVRLTSRHTYWPLLAVVLFLVASIVGFVVVALRPAQLPAALVFPVLTVAMLIITAVRRRMARNDLAMVRLLVRDAVAA